MAGRPRVNPLDRKDKITTIRFSRPEIIKLSGLSERMDVSESEIVRMGIELVYQKEQAAGAKKTSS